MSVSVNLTKCNDKNAFVVGYTGEVGKELVRELLEKKVFKNLYLIGRRQVNYENPIYANAVSDDIFNVSIFSTRSSFFKQDSIDRHKKLTDIYSTVLHML